MSRHEIATPARVLFIFVFVAQFLTGIYAALATELPFLFEILYPVVTTWLVWWWIKEDSAGTRESWPIDLGLFLFVAWPVIVPYYLIKTRGISGLVGVVAFIAILVAAWLSASAVAVFFFRISG
jgi:hypothetical protein